MHTLKSTIKNLIGYDRPERSSMHLLSTKKRRAKHFALGFSLTELLVALLIGSGVTSTAATIVFFNRNLYLKDSSRTQVNQNLRSSLDLTGNDIRQAGERLADDFPAIVLNPGGDTAGVPDQLITYRGLNDFAQLVCLDVTAGTGSDVAVADTSLDPTTGDVCAVDSDIDTGLLDWQAFRDGGTVDAYIYDPVTNLGEFFEYDGEDTANYTISRASGTWTNSYPKNNLPRLYILEKKEFFLSSMDAADCTATGDILTMVVNDDCANGRIALTNTIEDFQISICMQGGLGCVNTMDRTTSANAAANSGWADISSVQVTLTGSSNYAADQEIQKVLSSNFFPRNVLSY